MGPRKFQRRDTYLGREEVLAAIQQAIVAGDTPRTADLQALDDALEIQHMFERRSWHEAPEVVRSVGLEFWEVVCGLYDDIPEYISQGVGLRCRAAKWRRAAAFVFVVAGLVGIGAALRDRSVIAREAEIADTEDGQRKSWEKIEERWESLVEKQRQLLPDDPVFHIPEEEIDARRQDRDDRNN